METAEKRIVELFASTLRVALTDRGEGPAFVLLHGGAGPASMAALADALPDARVITLTHPGFNGEPRPEWFRRPEDLATAYLAVLDALDVRDAVLVGNSFGGWVACEIALRASPRVAGLALLNAVGIDTGNPAQPIVDPTTLPPEERVHLSYFNPAKFAVAPSAAALAAMLDNQKALKVYATESGFMHDPGLRARLAGVRVPTLVAWGEHDRIVDVNYGRRLAQAIPGARFVTVAEAGHFPHIEQRDTVAALLRTVTSQPR